MCQPWGKTEAISSFNNHGEWLPLSGGALTLTLWLRARCSNHVANPVRKPIWCKTLSVGRCNAVNRCSFLSSIHNFQCSQWMVSHSTISLVVAIIKFTARNNVSINLLKLPLLSWLTSILQCIGCLVSTYCICWTHSKASPISIGQIGLKVLAWYTKHIYFQMN